VKDRGQQTPTVYTMVTPGPAMSISTASGSMARQSGDPPCTASGRPTAVRRERDAAERTVACSAARQLLSDARIVNLYVVFTDGIPRAQYGPRELMTDLDLVALAVSQVISQEGSSVADDARTQDYSHRGGMRGPRACAWLRVDEERKFVSVEGAPVDLSRKEYDTLLCLYRKNGTVCSRDELIANVWPEAHNANGVSDSAVDQLVHRLRLKVEPDPGRPAHLLSRKGFGFMLV
jgi:hypothetical protein